MTEADCKSTLCKVLRELLPPSESRVYRHEDAWTGGIPDISITYHGKTLWVEVKLDKPGRRGKVTELQRASLIALQGYLLTFVLGRGNILSARFEQADGTLDYNFASDTRIGLCRSIAQYLLWRLP